MPKLFQRTNDGAMRYAAALALLFLVGPVLAEPEHSLP